MSSEPVLQIESLSYRYPNGVSALEDVSLQIAEGEKLALIGPNGAGKSTLTLHLNGTLVGQGKISVCGLAVTRKNLKAVRQKVGMVFQDSDDQLFCPTVYDDVAFGPRNLHLGEREVAERVEESLRAVGLVGLEKRGSYHLSVGEKRRLAIATVLALEAAVLVLDEPTNSLDPRGRKEIIKLLKKLGRTQVIVTHDLDLAGRLCDRVAVLSAGRIVAQGTAGSILADHALLEEHGLE